MVDVARTAGVSLKTVSRVINEEPGVKPATIEKVLEAAKALRYERNDLAASLRHGARSFTLGLVIEDVANPFYSAIAQAVEESARERSSLLITASAREDPHRERELVMALLRRRVDGLLVVPAGNDHRYIRDAGLLDQDRVPGPASRQDQGRHRAGRERRRRPARGRAPGGAAVTPGSHSWATTCGCSPPANAWPDIAVRCGRAGIEVDAGLVSIGSGTSTSAKQATHQLMALPPARRPTAIFAGNNRCTVGALHALNGKRNRVALVGFDDFELADLLGVTVVRADPYQIGQLGAELAFDRIDGDEGEPQRVVVSVELVARGSGELRP